MPALESLPASPPIAYPLGDVSPRMLVHGDRISWGPANTSAGIVDIVAPSRLHPGDWVVALRAEGKPVNLPERHIRFRAGATVRLLAHRAPNGTTPVGAGNPALIAEQFAPQYIAPLDVNDVVADFTWGKGGWWSEDYLPHCHFWASDLGTDLPPIPTLRDPDQPRPVVAQLNGGVDVRSLPHATGSVAVGLFDPPYVAPGTVERSSLPAFHPRYGLRTGTTPASLLSGLFIPALVELHRVVRPDGILAMKAMNYVSGGTLILAVRDIIDAAVAIGWEPWDEIVHAGYPGAQPTRNRDGSLRLPQRTRSGSSFLWVFRRIDAPAGPDVTDPAGSVGRAHPATSRRASTSLKHGSERHRVLMLLGITAGMTARAIARELDSPPNQIAARLGELHRMGYAELATVDGVPVEADTTPGNRGRVHVITAAGRVELARLAELDRQAATSG